MDTVLTGASSRRIGSPERGELIEAIALLFSGGETGAAPARGNAARAAAQRFKDHCDRHALPLESLVCRREGARLVAAAIALPGPGRTAQLICSRPRMDEVEAMAELIAEACARLGPRAASVVQSLLEARAEDGSPLHAPMAAALDRAGFHRLAVLDYMERPVPKRREAAFPALPPGIEIAPWQRGDPTLERVLEASYEGTLDCAALCGLRRTQDILAGHLASGRYEPALWLLLHVDGCAAGAALLSPAHGADEIDLIYLGLARTVRGRGLGRLLLQASLARTAGRPERRIALAVDRINIPAVGLYRSFGFRPFATRLAFFRPIGP